MRVFIKISSIQERSVFSIGTSFFYAWFLYKIENKNSYFNRAGKKKIYAAENK